MLWGLVNYDCLLSVSVTTPFDQLVVEILMWKIITSVAHYMKQINTCFTNLNVVNIQVNR